MLSHPSVKSLVLYSTVQVYSSCLYGHWPALTQYTIQCLANPYLENHSSLHLNHGENEEEQTKGYVVINMYNSWMHRGIWRTMHCRLCMNCYGTDQREGEEGCSTPPPINTHSLTGFVAISWKDDIYILLLSLFAPWRLQTAFSSENLIVYSMFSFLVSLPCHLYFSRFMPWFVNQHGSRDGILEQQF
jgi:hypothetical protein